jgi:hypothetical protein
LRVARAPFSDRFSRPGTEELLWPPLFGSARLLHDGARYLLSDLLLNSALGATRHRRTALSGLSSMPCSPVQRGRIPILDSSVSLPEDKPAPILVSTP